jgi:hypothetical protein
MIRESLAYRTCEILLEGNIVISDAYSSIRIHTYTKNSLELKTQPSKYAHMTESGSAISTKSRSLASRKCVKDGVKLSALSLLHVVLG